MRRGTDRLLASLIVATCAYAAEAGASIAGVCAYGAGRYEEAAIRLEADGFERDDRARYFHARALEQLGLEGRAAADLERLAEAGAEPWRALSRRALAHARLAEGAWERVGSIAAAGPFPGDPELQYLAGLAASALGRWDDARASFDRVPQAHPAYAFARFAAGQAAAASGDLDGALREFAEVIAHAPSDTTASHTRLRPHEALESSRGDLEPFSLSFRDVDPEVSLRDQAHVLRGKIFYLRREKDRAREEFAAVEGPGEAALEAVRGLALIGALDAATRLRGARRRPLEEAAMWSADALAAERSGDLAREWRARAALQGIASLRLRTLDHLERDHTASAGLARDLAVFAARLAEARAEQRWIEERESLDTSCSFERTESVADLGFRPRDPVFHPLWRLVRRDHALSEQADLAGAVLRLQVDLMPGAPVPRDWGADLDRRLDALRGFRLDDLERRAGLERGETASAEPRQKRVRALLEALSTRLERLIPPVVRVERAIFERIEADDARAYARLYAAARGDTVHDGAPR